MRLGDILLGGGLVEVASIVAALRRQVVHGGRFGTCIVEVCKLDLDEIASALAEQHEIAAATAPHFARADAAVMRKLSPEVAAKYRAIPLGMLSRDPARIAVASTDPLDDNAVGELSALLEADVVTAIAPELRILYYLEAVYGIERLARFRRARTTDRPASAPPEEGSERRRYIQTLSEADISGFDAPTAPNALAKIAVRRVAVVVGEDQPPRLETVEGGVRAIRRATGRDRVGDYVVGTLENAFNGDLRSGIVFAARASVLIGWKGFTRAEGNPAALESMALEVTAESMVREPFVHGVHYFGAPKGLPIDALIWRAMGLGAPAEIAVVPIVLRQDVVCLLYADSDKAMDAATVGGLAELGQGLAAAFDRLVRAGER